MTRQGLRTVVAFLALGACGDGARSDIDPPPAEDPFEASPGSDTLVIGAAEPVDTFSFLPADLARLDDRWTGDYPAMLERGAIRLLTVFGDGYYYLDGAKELGFTYELARELERWVNEREGRPRRAIRVVILPVTLDRLVPLLTSGYGDVAAAGLTVTRERAAEVAFTRPLIRDVREVLVTGPASPALDGAGDLAGQSIPVRPGSSYEASVARLSDSLRAAGRDPIEPHPVDRHVDDETLLRLVSSGQVPWAVVDDFKARMWAGVLPDLVIREDIVFRQGGEIAWAVRPDAAELKGVLDAFIAEHREGTLVGNLLLNRYVEDHAWLSRAAPGLRDPDFRPFAELFRRYADRYGLDWRALAAQAYRESRLRQELRSPRGAVGVMQLLPSTAASLGIEDIDVLENNVQAGAAYMAHLRDRYFDEPSIDPENRYLFALAAYNAGPNRINRLRRETADAGLDPHVWYDNVEILAARDIGRETVQYVSSVMRRYLAYRLISDQWGSP